MLAWLVAEYPALGGEIFDPDGNLHRFVNVYVNDQGLEDLRGLETPLEREDEVAVIPAMPNSLDQPSGARRVATLKGTYFPG